MLMPPDDIAFTPPPRSSLALLLPRAGHADTPLLLFQISLSLMPPLLRQLFTLR
jgi:hypothetical protein